VTLTVSLAPTLSPGPIGASSSAAPGALGISVGILSMLMLPTAGDVQSICVDQSSWGAHGRWFWLYRSPSCLQAAPGATI
jgi:hypothetical protein